MIWLKRTFCVLSAAYLGGFAPWLLTFVIQPESSVFQSGWAFGVSLVAMIFTLPGTILVAMFYWLLRLELPVWPAYGLTLLFGAVSGGTMLSWFVEISVPVFAFGAIFGLSTTFVWAVLNRFVFRAF
jgi:hypothetical protein